MEVFWNNKMFHQKQSVILVEYIYTDDTDGTPNKKTWIECNRAIATILIYNKMQTRGHIITNHSTTSQHNFTFYGGFIVKCPKVMETVTQ